MKDFDYDLITEIMSIDPVRGRKRLEYVVVCLWKVTLMRRNLNLL